MRGGKGHPTTMHHRVSYVHGSNPHPRCLPLIQPPVLRPLCGVTHSITSLRDHKIPMPHYRFACAVNFLELIYAANPEPALCFKGVCVNDEAKSRFVSCCYSVVSWTLAFTNCTIRQPLLGPQPHRGKVLGHLARFLYSLRHAAVYCVFLGDALPVCCMCL